MAITAPATITSTPRPKREAAPLLPAPPVGEADPEVPPAALVPLPLFVPEGACCSHR